MDVSYSAGVENNTSSGKLATYRNEVRGIIECLDFTKPESALATWGDELMRSKVKQVTEAMGEVSHVVLIGIGGSSLGTEAIHKALSTNTTKKLYVLDAVSDSKMHEILAALKGVAIEDVVICAISKSGGTTETLSNLDVFMTELQKQSGLSQPAYDRLICIGNEGNALLKKAAALGAHTVSMQEAVGGRFSVFTSVGLVPLKLLGHNIDDLLLGLSTVLKEINEDMVAASASSLYQQLLDGKRNLNLFTFATELEKMSYWQRQLMAESIGKEFDEDGNVVEIGFIPTISTAVELHSIGQLYFSGFKGVLTDFLVVDNRLLEHFIDQESAFAPQLASKSLQEVSYAIEQGVLAAYSERGMSYRQIKLSALREEEIGLYMGMRMLETMYLAKLMNVNAFDQPNVELYKIKTKEVLGV